MGTAFAVLAPVLIMNLVGIPHAAADVPGLGAGFEFGVAQAGFQSEGYNQDSNYLRYSNEGKLPERVGNSVDFYHQHSGDIQRAEQLGVKIYRLSVEWSRVEPRPGVWDPAGWAFYDTVIKEIVDAGMTPMITLNHWVHPGWEVDRGGWNRPAMADDMITFGDRVVDRYQWAKPIWITFNEPTEYVRRELMYGGLQPQNALRMVDGIIKAHKAIWAHVHAVQPGGQVSSNIAFMPIPGLQPSLEALFPDRMANTLDFIGVDQYYSVSIGDTSVLANGASGEYWKSSQSPESMYYVLRYLAAKYPGKPIRIVENGLVTDPNGHRDDGYDRADHLRDTIYWIQRAKQDGVDVMSYNYWSLTDNYEWGDYAPHYGLYHVDALHDPTLTRYPTDAVAAYRDITAHHGVPVNYRPTRQPVPCSLVTNLDSCTHPAIVK